MRLASSSGIAALLLVAAVAVPLSAVDVTVFSAGAVEEAIAQLASRYEKQHGNAVRAQFGTGPELEGRLNAGDAADVLVAPAAVVERASKAGKVVAGTLTPVGRVGVGVVVRRGAPRPDVSSVDALRRALQGAESVVYNQASTGQYLEGLFARMGIAEELKSKTTRYGNAARVFEHVIAGSGREIGFGPITEIKTFERKGLELVGPLPADVQNYTTYVAAVMTGGREAEARDFVRYLVTDDAKQIFFGTGVQ